MKFLKCLKSLFHLDGGVGSASGTSASVSVSSTNSSSSTSSSSSSSGVRSATGTIAGHEYVDLGLSVKWATCNVGANSPEDYGNYYAWGETSPKSSYTEENSKTCGKNMGNIGGNASYDAARANWGGTWRLPTADEINDLVENCKWKWTKMNGKNGCKFTSKVNGRSIFLPAAGHRINSSLDLAGSRGGYWGSTPLTSFTDFACYLDFYIVGVGRYDYYRCYGRSVRPVSE